MAKKRLETSASHGNLHACACLQDVKEATLEAQLNKLQRHNQHVVAEALRRPLVITCIHVDSRRVVGVQTSSWHEYWDGCDLLAQGLARLHASWSALVEHGYLGVHRSDFVHAYFKLLHSCLTSYRRDEINLSILGKVVGFETFGICGEQEQLVAGVFNVRNPVYLLSRIALPKAPEDPKFLPLICLPRDLPERSRLFCHYRRIRISKGRRAELFVYPPAEPRSCSSSYRLIGELFASLTPKNDPWVNERSQSLFNAAFGDVVAPLARQHIQLLDVACGSAKTSMSLCRKAFASYGTSFDLTLVDVVRGAKSIVNTFYRCPRVFGNVVFRHENLFDWIDNVSGESLPQFDLVLMLRICDVFSSFRIEKLSRHETAALLYRDRSKLRLDRDVTRPAKLLEENRLDRIQHRLWRSACRGGEVFHQFSLSDFFQAIQLQLGYEESDNDAAIYAPIRRFDESALVLASGDSLIAKLMTLGDRIIVEDSQLSADCLRRHIAEFGMTDFRVTDTRYRRGRRGSHVCVINRREALTKCSVISSATSTNTAAETRPL